LSTFSLSAWSRWSKTLDLALFEADELGRRAGVVERLARLDELDLLHAVGGEDRDLLAVQLAHVQTPLGRWPGHCRATGSRGVGKQAMG
jgi:hypothetical protein